MSDFEASDVPQLQFQSKFLISKISTSWTNPMLCSSGASANSFSDLTTPNRSQKPSAQTKNPDYPNEFVGLEHFEVEGAARLKMIHAMRSANPPAAGITQETSALRVTCKDTWRAAGNEIRASEDP